MAYYEELRPLELSRVLGLIERPPRKSFKLTDSIFGPTIDGPKCATLVLTRVPGL